MGGPAKRVNISFVLCAFLRSITTQHGISHEGKAVFSTKRLATWRRSAGGDLSRLPGQTRISFVICAFLRSITTQHEMGHEGKAAFSTKRHTS